MVPFGALNGANRDGNEQHCVAETVVLCVAQGAVAVLGQRSVAQPDGGLYQEVRTRSFAELLAPGCLKQG